MSTSREWNTSFDVYLDGLSLVVNITESYSCLNDVWALIAYQESAPSSEAIF